MNSGEWLKQFDYLVIGGGVAGLTFALEVAKEGRVAVLFKKGVSDSSTAWAQGGVAAVGQIDDSIESHIEDTLEAGVGLCNREIVELVVTEGPARISELISRGAKFDKEDGKYHLHQEGGHSRRRIYHTADATGWEIQKTLLAAVDLEPNIEIFPDWNAFELITTHKLDLGVDQPNATVGAYVLSPQQEVVSFMAEKILVATGGAGKVYLYTSNPDVASGDGVAMCYRAGVPVANMEFFQFHPTCLFHPKAKSLLITEAMRGEGAVLRRINGESFVSDFHPRGELAPRDVVARAIDYCLKQHGEEYVYLDISHRPADFVKEHFPTIYQQCLKYGFDITTGPIPVVPAAHYSCGGVVSDKTGRTLIRGLYVAGECAHTGLHGANRLASNSLLEGLVFAHRAANSAIEDAKRFSSQNIVPAKWDPGSAVDSDEAVVITQNWDEIRRLMWNYVGIVRTDKRLRRALSRIELIKWEIQEYYWNFKLTSDLLELRNLALVAELVIRSALSRKESRGLHYNLDYPERSSKFQKDTIIDPEIARDENGA